MNKKWLLVMVVLASIVAICCGAYLTYYLIDQVEKTNAELQRQNGELANASFRAQVAERKLERYSEHEIIVSTLAARDEAIDTLARWQGRTLMVKHDSSLVVCQAIFFGGDAFEHRIWCRVYKKDGSIADMSPTLLRPL